MRTFFVLLAALLFLSCKDKSAPQHSFYFENPQPVNDSELSRFPDRFLGRFMASDSSFMVVSKTTILSESYLKFRIHKLSLDTLKDVVVYKNKTIKNLETNDLYDVIQRGDSLELTQKDIDTLFLFSDLQKAKRLGNDLVLNTKDSIFWKTEWLSLKDKALQWHYFASDNDIHTIDSIIKVKPKLIDSSYYLIKPTKSEFKKIIRHKSLGELKEFKKV